MAKACGNPECCTSTGIHEGLTFGSGELDSYGYWSKPCVPCARAFDARQAETRERIRADCICYGSTTAEDSEQFLRQNHEWLFIPGWPYPAAAVIAEKVAV